MSTANACPGREQLQALASGDTVGAQTLKLHEHIASCSYCRGVFDSLTAATLPIQGVKVNEAYPFLSAPVMTDEIGRLANYRILKPIGQGGMGIVFQAEDIALARPVALKVMKPELKADRDSWQRFLREARAMASLKHENLVTVYNAGEDRDVAYFAMELLEGESLEARMRREPRPSSAEILEIARQVAQGLAFIHDKNMLHRDIKPANIWLEHLGESGRRKHENGKPSTPMFRVKILDLGLVRPIVGDSGLTASGIIMGTPDYMSPEQASGEPIDARTDLFSLGAVLYYLATGRRPFEAPTLSAVLMALASRTPTSAHEVNRKIPRGLSDLITSLLARHPKQRPASAHEVIDRLEGIASGVEVAQDAIQPEPTLKRPRPSGGAAESGRTLNIQKRSSNKGLIIGIVAAVVLLVLFVVGVGGGIVSWTLMARRPVADGKNVGKDVKPPQPADQAVPPNPVAEKIFLADMKPVATQFWPFKKTDMKKKPKDKDKEEKEFSLDVRYQNIPRPKGIFMHPPTPPNEFEPASLTYALDGKYKTFEAMVTLNDGPPQSAVPLIFRVIGDGNELWKSNPVNSQADTQTCKVSVRGINELKISVTGGDMPKAAHAVWIDPVLTR